MMLSFTCSVTALFNNMGTLTFKAQPTNAFFPTVNQMFGSSSQSPTTAECMVINKTVLGSSQRLEGAAEHLSGKFLSWALNFRVCMLLKDAVHVGDTWVSVSWKVKILERQHAMIFLKIVYAQLFCKNLGNLREIFWKKWFTPPPPSTPSLKKLVHTPIASCCTQSDHWEHKLINNKEAITYTHCRSFCSAAILVLLWISIKIV